MNRAAADLQQYSFDVIGFVRSPFKEKFGIPRQPGLVPVKAELELSPPYNNAEAVKGLEGFSHLWLIFIFHGIARREWSPTVRPPRLGGNARMGVFATRSTHRPNPIGLSVVALERIEVSGSRVILHLSGADLMDGTPVLDIKPYLPYADHVPQATAGFAPDAPAAELDVIFTAEAVAACRQWEEKGYQDLHAIIMQLLRYDPRPAYYGEKPGKQEFGMRLYDFDLRWRLDGQLVVVTQLQFVGHES